jgi:AcrR family transcriptional regulator
MSEPSPTRRPGRPRSEQARRAVLEAALALAAEQGPQRLSMEAIARRSGVSKDTLYRWWRSKAEVVLEALTERGRTTIPLPDTGTMAGDLETFLLATAASGDAPTQRLLRALAAEAAADPAFATLVYERFLVHRRADLGTLLDRAVARGEITPADARTTVELVYGSLWYRLIFGFGELDDGWASDLTRTLARRPDAE